MKSHSVYKHFSERTGIVEEIIQAKMISDDLIPFAENGENGESVGGSQDP